MKLSKMNIGMFVQYTNTSLGGITYYGWVVGLTTKHIRRITPDIDKEDILPLIHFVGEDIPRPVHPSYLTPLKD